MKNNAVFKIPRKNLGKPGNSHDDKESHVEEKSIEII